MYLFSILFTSVHCCDGFQACVASLAIRLYAVGLDWCANSLSIYINLRSILYEGGSSLKTSYVTWWQLGLFGALNEPGGVKIF